MNNDIGDDRREQLLHVGLLALRLGFGLSLSSVHGFAKLTDAINYLLHGTEWKFIAAVAGLGFPAPVVFAVSAALAESVGASLLALGVFTRGSAAVVAFTMLVAVYRHISAGQGAELAALYLIPSIALALTGGGKYALESLWERRSRNRLPNTQEATA